MKIVHNGSQPEQCGTTVIDASKLNLLLHSDINVPPYFRGDNSDKCSVFEWGGVNESLPQ